MNKKRTARCKQTAEIFTPIYLVNQMCDKLEEYSPEIFINPLKTIIDPACGNGNMLIPPLIRKMKHTDPVTAISTLYGCDIMEDNIDECRLRLFKVIETYKTKELLEKDYLCIVMFLHKNIVCTSLSKYPNGSLDYLSLPCDETFNDVKSLEECEKILSKMLWNIDKVSIVM